MKKCVLSKLIILAAVALVLGALTGSPLRAQVLYHITDLGVLPGGSYSCAEGTNDSGQVVGWSDSASGCRAFLWDREQGMQNLGVTGGPRSYAEDINDAGQVVGYSYPDGGWRAFLWDREHGMQDLNDLLAPDSAGWTLHSATGIDNAGQIVGRAQAPDGTYRAFLATPTPIG